MIWWNSCFGNADPFQMVPMKTKKKAEFKNSVALQNTMMKWSNLALMRHEWTGLPDTCDARILEMSFLIRGCGMMLEKGGAFYTPIAMPGADFNLYGNPTKAWAYGLNGFNEEVRLYVPGADGKLVMETVGGMRASKAYNAVLGWDNMTRYPYINYIIDSSIRLADIRRAADVVRDNMKQPMVAVIEESSKKSVEDAITRRDQNCPVIVVPSRNINPDSWKVFDTGVHPETLKEFAEAENREENYLREVFGMNNLPNEDKRERLITDEAEANNEVTSANTDIRLEMRRKFCEDVNEAFGLSISVDIRGGRPEDAGADEDEEEEEEEEEEDDV